MALNAVVPDRFKRGAHHWLILHGRYVCVARRPNCPACVVRDLCRYPDKTPAPLLSAGRSHRRRPAGVSAQPVRRRSAASIRQVSMRLRLRQHHAARLPGSRPDHAAIAGSAAVSKHKGGKPAKCT